MEREDTNLSPGSHIAHCIEKPVPPVDRQNLLEHKRKKKCTTRAENNIVYLEKEGKLLWLTCLHDFADAKDSGEIASEDAENDWLGRKRSRTADIMGEMIGNMGDGNIFKKKISKRSHSGDGGRRETVTGENTGELSQRRTSMTGLKRNFKFLILTTTSDFST